MNCVCGALTRVYVSQNIWGVCQHCCGGVVGSCHVDICEVDVCAGALQCCMCCLHCRRMLFLQGVVLPPVLAVVECCSSCVCVCVYALVQLAFHGMHF